MDKVLCYVETIWEDFDEQELWMDLELPRMKKIEVVIPLLNHPHNDVENGQPEIHYHPDSRYTNNVFHSLRRIVPSKFSPNEKLEIRLLTKLSDKIIGRTHVDLISKSKLKNKCIHKGKCPHRGYDLSNEIPDENGIITCPLHSLKFKAETKELINSFN